MWVWDARWGSRGFAGNGPRGGGSSPARPGPRGRVCNPVSARWPAHRSPVGRWRQRYRGKTTVSFTRWQCGWLHTTSLETFLRCPPATGEMTPLVPKGRCGQSQQRRLPCALGVLSTSTHLPPASRKHHEQNTKALAAGGNEETLFLDCAHGSNAGQAQPHL